MPKEHKADQRRRGLSRGRIIGGAILVAVVLSVGMVLLARRAPQEDAITVAASGDRLHRVRAGDLPAFAASESSLVQTAYRYAAAHPEVLQYIPCFCGCEMIGHRHNGDCYVQAARADGTITFTSHGAT
jgi:hypothetical protein